jgi:hypothetical protein
VVASRCVQVLGDVVAALAAMGSQHPAPRAPCVQAKRGESKARLLGVQAPGHAADQPACRSVDFPFAVAPVDGLDLATWLAHAYQMTVLAAGAGSWSQKPAANFAQSQATDRYEPPLRMWWGEWLRPWGLGQDGRQQPPLRG